MSGILTLRTGGPITFTDNGGLINAPNNTETPNLYSPIQILHGINVGNPWFSRASFAAPPSGTWGMLGRGVISGPGQFRLDLGLSRWINLNERLRLQIRGDAINFTNTPFFNNPATDRNTSSSFGYVTGTVGSGVGVNGFSAARSVQLSMKVLF